MPDKFAQQGMIFCGAVAEDYAGRSVHGLLITARCDIRHEKVRTYSYLPIVRLEDWIRCDMRYDLARKVLTEEQNNLDELLQRAGISSKILNTLSIDAVIEANGPNGNKKLKESQCDKLLRMSAGISLARRESTAPEPTADFETFRRTYTKFDTKFIKDCITQSLPEYYFVPEVSAKVASDTAVSDDAPSVGYVVLLREMRHMPSFALQRIVDEADYGWFEEARLTHLSLPAALAIKPGEAAYPTGVLESPFIEELLQAFMMLFGRIGTPDLPAPAIEKFLSEHAPNSGEPG